MYNNRKHVKLKGEVQLKNADELKKSVFVILSGLPGVGKSFLAERLKELLGEQRTIVLEGDLIWKEFFPNPSYTSSEGRIVHSFIHEQALMYLKEGYIVIYDATNLKQSYRETAQQIAHKAGADYVMVEVKACEDLVKERLNSRIANGQSSSEADYDVYKSMKQISEPICGEHITVYSKKNSMLNIDKLTNRISKLSNFSE